MNFDDLVASVVPAELLPSVTDLLVGIGFVSALASQAWDLHGWGRMVVLIVFGFEIQWRRLSVGRRRRRRRFGLVD